MNIGERIKQLREQKGWSLTKLAQESGVSKPYLSQVENSPNKKISAELLYSIATALDVTIAQLMGRETRLVEQEQGDIPESLRAYAERMNLNDETIRMLAGIKYRGKSPSSEKDWDFIYHTIKIAVERGE